MCTFLFLFVMIFMVTIVHAQDVKAERARNLPPKLVKAYIKGNPNKIWIEQTLLEPLVSIKDPTESKMVVVRQAQEFEIEDLKVYRLDGAIVTKEEIKTLFKHPKKVVYTEQAFDKENEFYSCFDKQMLVISRPIYYPGESIEVQSEKDR